MRIFKLLLFMFISTYSFCSVIPKKITVLYLWEYKPYNFFDKKGELSGFNIEMLKLIGKKLNLEMNFVKIDNFSDYILEKKTKGNLKGNIRVLRKKNKLNTALKMMSSLDRNENIIAILPISILNKNQNKISFYISYMHDRDYSFMRLHSNIHSVDDLINHNYKVGVIKDSTEYTILKKILKKENIIQIENLNPKYITNLLLTGKTDLLIVPSFLKINSAKIETTKIKNLSLKTEIGLIFPKKSALIQQFNTVISKLIKEGVLFDIQTKWGGLFNEQF